MGRKEFETIVANAVREKLVQVTDTKTASLGPSTSESLLVYSAPNTVSKLLALYLNAPAPAGATTGTHTFFVSYANPIIDIIAITSNYGDALTFNKSRAVNATNQKEPATEEALITALKDITFDDVSPLRVTYNNSTNAATTQTRDIRLWLRQITTA